MCDIEGFPEKGDSVDIYIEDDGTITIRTSGISGELHRTAEEFLEWVTKEVGGVRHTEQHKGKAAIHKHTHKQLHVRA